MFGRTAIVSGRIGTGSGAVYIGGMGHQNQQLLIAVPEFVGEHL
jgi:hypothetical protein